MIALTIFTIHFATINTVQSLYNLTVAKKFTIHFATINTDKFHAFF